MSFAATCPACGHSYALASQVAGKRLKCKQCGRAFVVTFAGPTAASMVSSVAPEDAATPLQTYPQHGASPAGDAVAALIPYRNAPALISYYLGVFSLIPCIGAALGIAAVVLGIMGLKLAARNPAAKGKAHAIVGIVCGGIFGLIWLLVAVFMLVSVIVATTSK